jgi:hypothetical protein
MYARLIRRVPQSPCLGGPSAGLRSRLSPFNSEQGGQLHSHLHFQKAFVLAAPEASLRSLLSGFNSRQRLYRDVSRREAALIRLTARVQIPPSRPSRCGSIWLEHRVRDAGTAGSNPATSTIHDRTRGASQLETAPGLHPGLAWVRFPGPALPVAAVRQLPAEDHNDLVDLRRLISACGVGSIPRWSTTSLLN